MSAFDPIEYVNQFYSSDFDEGTEMLLKFYIEAYSGKKGTRMLEFGGGPTICSLIAAAKVVQSIHFADYYRECIDEIDRWIKNDPRAYKWDNFIENALRIERVIDEETNGVEERVKQRKAHIQDKIVKTSLCNAFSDDILLGNSLGNYDIVASNFCLDGITQHKETWRNLHKKLSGLLSQNGCYIVTSLLGAKQWAIGSQIYPAVYLQPLDVVNLFNDLNIDMKVFQVYELNRDMYDGFILASGQLKSE